MRFAVRSHSGQPFLRRLPLPGDLLGTPDFAEPVGRSLVVAGQRPGSTIDRHGVARAKPWFSMLRAK